MNSLTHLFRQIQNNNFNDKEVLQTLKNLITIDEPRNIKTYILELQSKADELLSLLYENSNRIMLIDNNKAIEKNYTPKELADKLRITKDAIFKHIKAGNIEYSQATGKGGAILISSKAIDDFVEKHKKYKNIWDNRFFM